MKKTISIQAILMGLASLLLISTAHSAVLYEQPTLHPDSDLGAYSYSGQQMVDDFSLSNTATVGSITWKGGYYSGNPVADSFTVNIFTDDAGLPSLSSIYSFAGTPVETATPDTRSGITIFDYSLDIADVVLNASTTYWISIISDLGVGNFAWSNSSDGSSEGAFGVAGSHWNQHDSNTRTNHVFALLSSESSSVPVPAPLALMGLGLVVLGFTRKQKA